MFTKEQEKEAAAVRKLLVQRFPLAFKAKGEIKVPLKIGVHNDIMDACPDISKDEINMALVSYTSGPKYLIAMVKGAIRVDLKGQPAGHVTGAAARLAKERAAKQTTPKVPA